MAALEPLLHRLERLPVLPGAFGEPRHVCVDYDTFAEIVNELRAAERRRKVPRETKRAS